MTHFFGHFYFLPIFEISFYKHSKQSFCLNSAKTKTNKQRNKETKQVKELGTFLKNHHKIVVVKMISHHDLKIS